MTRSGFSLASAYVGRRIWGVAGGGNFGGAGATPNMVLPRARALVWLLAGWGRGSGKATAEGGMSFRGAGPGENKADGTPNKVFCTDAAAGPMALPVLGQMRRLASCSCPQWVQILTGGLDLSPIPSSLRNARFQTRTTLPKSKGLE